MQEAPARVSTGTPGLDDVVDGGLPPNRMYLVQGPPGSGKTTLSLGFLLEGARRGEPVLYVTLSETSEEVQSVARAHGWSLDGVTLYEMSDTQDVRAEEDSTLFEPAEVELGARMERLLRELDRVRPRRVVIDSITELRLLSQTPLRFRRQILALKQVLAQRQCTMLLVENPGRDGADAVLQSLVHGVVELDQEVPEYGADRRRLRVVKLREVRCRGGWHDVEIVRGGLVVYPRLVAAEHLQQPIRGKLASGDAHLDTLLGGGLDRSTSTLVLGPAGTGKTSFATRFVAAAFAAGEASSVFTFDEGRETLLARAAGLGMSLQPGLDAGLIQVQQVDPAELSPGAFVSLVRASVEERGARVVVIDSLNGYLHAMMGERHAVVHLHELITYLRHHGVVTILVEAQHGLLGGPVGTPLDVSYLADTVVLLRYFEADGRVRKAISVLKKRGGAHAADIRELTLDPGGLRVGPPLAGFRAVLSGQPEWVGVAAPKPGHDPG
jgi:circadian clock protein KaiC